MPKKIMKSLLNNMLISKKFLLTLLRNSAMEQEPIPWTKEVLLIVSLTIKTFNYQFKKVKFSLILCSHL